MRVRCQHCSRVLVINDAHAGRMVRCPACQQMFSISTSPLAEPSAAVSPQIPLEFAPPPVQNPWSELTPGQAIPRRWTPGRKIELLGLLVVTLAIVASPIGMLVKVEIDPRVGLEALAKGWIQIGLTLTFLAIPIILLWLLTFLRRIASHPRNEP